MAAESETLAHWQSIRDETRERLAEITASPKPTYDIDGQKVEWEKYHTMLTKTHDYAVKQCRRLGTDEDYEEISELVPV